MTTEHYHGQTEENDGFSASSAVLPANTVHGEMTEYEYESALEATQAERAQMVQEAAWEKDPDWQAFQALCFSDTEVPNNEAIRNGVLHLIAAAQRGHAPAQCRLATELYLGEGRFGIQPDVRKAVAWYRAAAKYGDPIALQSLVVLGAMHQDLVEK